MRGWPRGGVARVGQIQLGQPVLTLLWSALLLGEVVTPAALAAAVLVLACVVLTQRTRAAAQAPKPAPAPIHDTAHTTNPTVASTRGAPSR